MADQSNHSAGEEDQEAPPRREAQAESLRGRREVYPLVHASMLFHTTTGVISFSVFSLGQSEGRGPLQPSASGHHALGPDRPSPQKQLTGEIPAGFLRKQFANLRPPFSPPVPLDVEEAFSFSGLFLSLLAFPCLM